MKRFFVIASIVLILMACDNGTMETEKETNPFIGKWDAGNGYYDVFTKDTITVYDTNEELYWKANYTYDETHITVRLDTNVSSQQMIDTWGEVSQIPYFFRSHSELIELYGDTLPSWYDADYYFYFNGALKKVK